MRGTYKSVKEFYAVENINKQRENELKERFIDQREKQRLQFQQRQERYVPAPQKHAPAPQKHAPAPQKQRALVPQQQSAPSQSASEDTLNFEIPNNSVSIEKENSDLNIKLQLNKYTTTASPKVWGPPMWFTLHNSASKYPINPSSLVRERMKNVIIGIPILLPCEVCKEHATTYIEKYFEQLDEICSSRDNLFKFFVDFHNKVNERHDKPLMTYEAAYALYNNGNVSVFSYS